MISTSRYRLLKSRNKGGNPLSGLNLAAIWWTFTFIALGQYIIMEWVLFRWRQDKVAVYAAFAFSWIAGYAFAPVLTGLAVKMPGGG